LLLFERSIYIFFDHIIEGYLGMIVSKRKFVSEMVKQTLGESISFCKISGPSFADEMIKHFPTVVVAASENPEVPS